MARKSSDNIKQLIRKEGIPTAALLAAVLAFRSMVAEPYKVPTGSMEPTILPGDRLIVSKLSYDLRVPWLGYRIASLGKPQRGDIIVFKYPRDTNVDYVKRVVGLPGDMLEVVDGYLTINGERLKTTSPAVVPREGRLPGVPGDEDQAIVYDETMGSLVHKIQRLPHDPMPATGPLKVPDDQYYFMGDNRDNSNDSRYWGFVPADNLKGRATRIWFSVDWREGWVPSIRWSRIGTKL